MYLIFEYSFYLLSLLEISMRFLKRKRKVIKKYAQKIGTFSRLISPYGKTETDDLIKFITFKY